MITAQGLTGRYGDRTVAQDLGLTVRPGTVTGFPGPALLAPSLRADTPPANTGQHWPPLAIAVPAPNRRDVRPTRRATR